jgi:methylthioribulose-1-phosphate dehydratase
MDGVGVATDFETAAATIVEAGRFLDRHGWAPAGSGNYSHRLDDGSIAITVSGSHKGRITAGDVMRVDVDGQSLDGRKPSAETLLHVLIYRLFHRVNAVVHTHSVPAVVLGRLREHDALIRLQGYELLKAFWGIETHDAVLDVPMFPNSQNMASLSRQVERILVQGASPVFMIRDHGLYGWGDTMDEALRCVEAAETLFQCEVELVKAGRR